MAIIASVLVLLPNFSASQTIPVSQETITPIVIKKDIVKKDKVTIEEAKAMITEAFPNAPVMLKIAKAESKYCQDNVNPHSSARGCFQILKGTWRDYKCQGSVMIPEDNIKCAVKIYKLDGTTPWNASKYSWGK